MDSSRLVMMANQIAAFHRRKPPEEAAAEIKRHILRFWEPRMRAEIAAFVADGGEGLDPNARAAILALPPVGAAV